MKKLLALIALVALIVACSFFIEIKTAAAPPTDPPQRVDIQLPPEPKAPADPSPTLADKVVSAIETIETQGRPNCAAARGGSGERGCLQFQPATWRAYSRELYGEAKDQTPEREREVATYKAQEWLDAGYSARQIFLIWQQGNASPCKAGVNKFGVRFDSCAYAEKGMDLIESMR